MTIKHQHNLGKQEALKRIQDFATQLKNQYASDIQEAQETWEGDTGQFMLKAKGIKITGTVKVLDDTVEITSKIPMILKPFSSEIERLIRDELNKLLS